LKAQIPWLRVFVEGVVIVGSILLAFGLQAWWDGRRAAEEETQLLADLTEEFSANRDRLQRTTDSHRVRLEFARTLTREAGPDSQGLSADSLNTLARRLLPVPVFEPERGVMRRAESGNGLAVVRDPALRADLAGFWDAFDYYFRNQWVIVEQVAFAPPVAFETGTLVWQIYPSLETLGSTTMWSDPLPPDQANALKFFVLYEFMGDLLIRGGESLLGDIDTLLVDLDSPGPR